MATVLVLTSHPTLTVTLTLQGEWDVVSDPTEVDERQRGGAIVLLDADDTQPVEPQLPTWASPERCVLLTSRDGPSEWPGPTLTRPYRFDHLMTVVRDLAAGGGPPGPSAPTESMPPPAPNVLTGADASSVVTSSAPVAVPTTHLGDDTPVGSRPLWLDEPLIDGVHSDASVNPEAPEGPDARVGETRGSEFEPAPVEDILAQAMADAHGLTEVLAQLPAVASRHALTGVLAEDVAAALGAPSVGVWQADAETMPVRYRFLGGVGMTPGETMVVVSVTHPVVADALSSGGTGVENIPSDPARVTGLPASRHSSLVVVPQAATPFGDLLVIAGLGGDIPHDAFDIVETAVQELDTPMQLCVELGRLADMLARP